MNEVSISVIVPVYNEEKLIKSAVEVLYDFLKANFLDFEIIIIESGSNDSTPQILETLQYYSEIIIIYEGKKGGFGSGLRLGYQNASKDYVCLVTVDFPFDLQYINLGMNIINNFDCVLSFRSSDTRNIYRKLQSLIYNILVKSILGLRVRQVNSAFKLFKRHVIQSLPLKECGWLIDAEIIYYLQSLKYQWIEIGVPLIEEMNRKSSTSFFSFIKVFIALIKFRYILKKKS